jgi:hypothetical protein
MSRKCRVRGGEQLSELVAPGVSDLAAKEGSGEFMCLIADYQAPAAIRGLELLLHILVARQLVQTGNDEVLFQEPVASTRRFQLVVGQDIKGQLKAPVEFALPLFSQAARADDEAALQIAAHGGVGLQGFEYAHRRLTVLLAELALLC